jgi:hypothetical protein
MTGFDDDIVDKDRKLDADLKGKLDFFIWHQRFKRAYQTWSKAPTNAKTQHLLTGEALSDAESRLMMHPTKFGDGERRFIMRSLAHSTERAVTAEVEDTERRRTPSFANIVIPLMAAAMLVALIALPRVLQQIMDPQGVVTKGQPTQVAGRPDPQGSRPAAPQRTAQAPTPAQTPTGAQRTSPTDAEVANGDDQERQPSATDGEAGQSASEGRSGIAGTGIARDGRRTNVPAENPTAAAANTTLSPQHRTGAADRAPPHVSPARAQRLLELASKRFAENDDRVGILLTVEAARLVAEMAPGRERDALGHTVTGDLLATFAEATPALAPLPPAHANRTNHFRRGGSALLAMDAGRRIGIAVFDQDGEASDRGRGGQASARRPAAWPHLTETAVDDACTRAVLIRHEDDLAEVWSLTEGKRTARLVGHAANLTAIAISYDGRLAATASVDRTVRLYDAATGRHWLTIAGHDERVTRIAFSPDSSLIASVGADRQVRLWSTTTGRPFGEPMTFRHQVETVAFSPDGATLVARTIEGSASLEQVGGSGARRVVRPPGRAITAAAFSADSQRLLVVSEDGSAQVYDATSGRGLFEIAGAPAGVRDLTPDLTGRLLLVTSWRGDATLHLGTTGLPIATLFLAPEGRKKQSTPRVAEARFTADGRRVRLLMTDGVVTTVAVPDGIAPALIAVTQAAGGCLVEEEWSRIGYAKPPAGACVAGQPIADTLEPGVWLTSGPARPIGRRVAGTPTGGYAMEAASASKD